MLIRSSRRLVFLLLLHRRLHPTMYSSYLPISGTRYLILKSRYVPTQRVHSSTSELRGICQPTPTTLFCMCSSWRTISKHALLAVLSSEITWPHVSIVCAKMPCIHWYSSYSSDYRVLSLQSCSRWLLLLPVRNVVARSRRCYVLAEFLLRKYLV